MCGAVFAGSHAQEVVALAAGIEARGGQQYAEPVSTGAPLRHVCHCARSTSYHPYDIGFRPSPGSCSAQRPMGDDQCEGHHCCQLDKQMGDQAAHMLLQLKCTASLLPFHELLDSLQGSSELTA